MKRCRRCHRVLKNPVQIKLGIGKVCARKEAWDAEKEKQETGDELLPYDGGAVWVQRIMRPLPSRRTGQQSIPVPCGVRCNVPRQRMIHGAGYEFGYGGSGPADLALNIMLLFCADPKQAERLHQSFKWAYLAATTPDDRLEIPRAEIERFIIANGGALKDPQGRAYARQT
jgi:hypothetical protein